MNENRPNPNSHNPCQELEDLLPAYVIGATTVEESERVRHLMLECPDATTDLETYVHIGVGLMEEVAPVAPPASLRDSILAQATNEDQDKETPSQQTVITLPTKVIPMRGWWVAAALLIFLIGSNLLWFGQVSNLSTERDELVAQNDEIKGLLTNLQLQQVALVATTEQSEAKLAHLLWNTDTNQATLVTDQLPRLDSAHAYQLWLIDDEIPVSAGVFDVDNQNRSIVTIPLEIDLSQFAAIAISVEPASGSEAPTTDPIAVGALEL